MKIKTIKYTIAALALSLGLAGLVVRPAAADTARQSVCSGIGQVADENGNCTSNGDGTSVESIVRTAISILSYLVGAIAVVMILLGAFKFVTSSGDANGVKSAKNTIIYALIGIVIAVMAQLLVRYVLTQATVTSTVTPSAPQGNADSCDRTTGAC